MQFFKHMANMRHDPKIAKLIKRYGVRGYGVYNLILECITENLASDRPMPELELTASDLAELYNDDTAQINEIVDYMLKNNLLEINNLNGRVLCTKLYRYLDRSQTRSQEIRNMINNFKMSRLSETNPDKSTIADRIEVEVEVEVEERRKNFTPPTIENIIAYMQERDSKGFTAEQFYDFYTMKGWMVGKNKMKDWRAAVRTWEKRSQGERKDDFSWCD